MLRVSEGVLYGLGRPRFIVVAGLFATVVDIGLAFLLIPSLDAVGAAIANGAAIVVAGVPCLALAVSLHRPASLPLAPLVRAVVLSLAVALAAYVALSLLGSIAAVVAGVIVGFGAALLLRPLAAEDAEWLAEALGESGARGVAAAFVARIGSRR
jgi:O-antigen/teichoic acid export membrane protein